MNPEKPTREQIETRITALLLGELPAEEAGLLRWTISQDAELQKLEHRLKIAIGLVRETVAHPQEAAAEKAELRKLSEERRQQLLAYFKAPRPEPPFLLKRLKISPLVATLAIVAIVAVLAAMFLPALASAKRRAISAVETKEEFQTLSAAPSGNPSVNAASHHIRTVGSSYASTIVLKPENGSAVTVLTAPTAAPPTPAAIVLPSGGTVLTGGGVLSQEIVGYAPIASNASKLESLEVAFANGNPGVANTPGGGTSRFKQDTTTLNATAWAWTINNLHLKAGNSSPSDGSGVESAVTEPGYRYIAPPDVSPGAGSFNGNLSWDDSDHGVIAGRVGGESAAATPSGTFGLSAPSTGPGETPTMVEAPAPASLEPPPPAATPAPPSEAAGLDTFGLSEKKPGNGTMALNGNNSFAGDTTTSAGTITAYNGVIATNAITLGVDKYYTGVTDEDTKALRFLLQTNGVAPGVNQAYLEKKSELDNLEDFQKLLAAKIDAKNADMEIPKSSMVTIVDAAQPGQSENTWQRIEGEVESKARIEIFPDITDISGLSGLPTASPGFDPSFLRKQIETIRSDAVLRRAVIGLKLDEAWAGKNGGVKLTQEEAIALLKKKLDLQAEPNTRLVDIGARSDNPQEAERIANAVAEAFQDYCADLRNQERLNGIKVLERELPDQAEKIRLAQAEVDRLGKELNVEQPDQALPKPPPNAPIPQPEVQTRDNAFSTFSLNVSDVSFKLAAASLDKSLMPDAASIRSEEFINAFDYRDPEATAGQPMAFTVERARYPFAHNRDLLRFSVKTAATGRPAGRALNLVLLLDTSGSMERADRVAIIREALRVLAGQLQPQDTVSVVTFARTARLWADGVPGDQAGGTLGKVGDITPDGGTNLEEAMRLAYATAHRHFLVNGLNRVVLLTDGAANLGNVDPAALAQRVDTERKQGIALDCFGIGWEDYNDDLLERLSSNGDGRYAFINSPDEAGGEFAAKLVGALQVAAQDVKVQVEFNPQRVIFWRQIGYAKHQLTQQQFRDNTVAAGEIAAKEAGNALYTIETKPDGEGPIATVRVRYRTPGTQDYLERSWDVEYTGTAPALEQSSPAMRLAGTAAAFAEWLATSPFAQDVTPDELLKYLSGVPQVYGADPRPQQLETMIREAKSVSGR